MSDSPAEQSSSEAAQAAASGFWPDETVDTIAALVVITCLTLGVLWYVVNG